MDSLNGQTIVQRQFFSRTSLPVLFPDFFIPLFIIYPGTGNLSP